MRGSSPRMTKVSCFVATLLAMTVEILALRTSHSHVLRGNAVERTDYV